MAQLTHEQYDILERAITDKRRIAVMRRGTEYVVVPSRLMVERGREAIHARHPGGAGDDCSTSTSSSPSRS